MSYLKIRQRNLAQITLSRLHGVYGTDQVRTLEILDEHTGAIETIEDPGCGIFVYAGTIPNTELYTQLSLENGFIPVNEKNGNRNSRCLCCRRHSGKTGSSGFHSSSRWNDCRDPGFHVEKCRKNRISENLHKPACYPISIEIFPTNF